MLDTCACRPVAYRIIINRCCYYIIENEFITDTSQVPVVNVKHNWRICSSKLNLEIDEPIPFTFNTANEAMSYLDKRFNLSQVLDKNEDAIMHIPV